MLLVDGLQESPNLLSKVAMSYVAQERLLLAAWVDSTPPPFLNSQISPSVVVICPFLAAGLV